MSAPASQLGSKLTTFVFTLTLLAFVVESQCTQYVQTTLSYSHPFFLFYLAHSCFIISLPCHLLYLTQTTGRPASVFIKGLKLAIIEHFSPHNIRTVGSLEVAKFPLYQFVFIVVAVTAAVTIPALLWFAAITISSVTDVTAIWNTNAFFSYLISVKVFGLKWEIRKLGAVVLATLGVLVVVYGGSTSSDGSSTSAAQTDINEPSKALIGDLMTFVASVGYAGYQVFYKKYAAFVDPEDKDEAEYEPLPNADNSANAHDLADEDVVYPPPYGLYSNMLTSAIGLCTMSLLWIPIPFLHWFGIESFALPQNPMTVVVILAIVLSGAVFNAGFMILLAILGPIITSVGGLLTIVLVFVSDVALGATEALNVWSVMGSATIIAAFGVLAYDILNRR
ncbi:hypothetical protein K435DRAFT_150060 [Dendrothele bispora CBS 962.96]|uniref:EamA domain-containing protein n=1 Tax=Dendrothele bispora (strain CBS 962.96) TaxID=1314807 RepID=A0A4S8MQ98_DENBC|nr:hypothetical protein K435DRAFT_150060 [Dendrothele bispora CBS 962.96]